MDIPIDETDDESNGLSRSAWRYSREGVGGTHPEKNQKYCTQHLGETLPLEVLRVGFVSCDLVGGGELCRGGRVELTIWPSRASWIGSRMLSMAGFWYDGFVRD